MMGININYDAAHGFYVGDLRLCAGCRVKLWQFEHGRCWRCSNGEHPAVIAERVQRKRDDGQS